MNFIFIAEKIFSRLPNQIVNSIAKFGNLKVRNDRSRDAFDLVKSQTVDMKEKKLNKNASNTKPYSRRVSCEANQVRTVFLGGSVNTLYVGSTIQCNNSRPVSRSKMRSPLVFKTKKNNRYNHLNSSKNSTISKQSSATLTNLTEKKPNIAKNCNVNLSSSNRKLFMMQNSSNAKPKRGRGIQKASSKARVLLKSHSSPKCKNLTMKVKRDSNPIDDVLPLSKNFKFQNSMKANNYGKVWS